MLRRNTEELITDWATGVARGFAGVDNQFKEPRQEMSERFDQVDQRLDRIECSVNGHDRRLDVLEDKVRRISVKIGLRART